MQANTYSQQPQDSLKDNLHSLTLLPTRQQLQAFLLHQGVNPEELKSMTGWELVQLTRTYYSQQKLSRLRVEPCS